MAKRRRTSRKRRNPVPVQFSPNPRRRRRSRRRMNPGPEMRPRVSRRRKYSYYTGKGHRRHNPSREGGGISIGARGSIMDGVLSLGAGGLGYFGGLMLNKMAGTRFVKYRGIALAIASLFAIWKIKDKHAKLLFVGTGVEGVVDALRQNVTTFANLSADDAAETLVLGEVSYTHGVPQLGNEQNLGNEEELGGESEGVYGEEDDGPPEGYQRALVGAESW